MMKAEISVMLVHIPAARREVWNRFSITTPGGSNPANIQISDFQAPILRQYISTGEGPQCVVFCYSRSSKLLQCLCWKMEIFLNMLILLHKLARDLQVFMDELCRTVMGIQDSPGDLGPSHTFFPALIPDALSHTSRAPFPCLLNKPSYWKSYNHMKMVKTHCSFVHKPNTFVLLLLSSSILTSALWHFQKKSKLKTQTLKSHVDVFWKLPWWRGSISLHDITHSTVAMGIQLFVDICLCPSDCPFCHICLVSSCLVHYSAQEIFPDLINFCMQEHSDSRMFWIIDPSSVLWTHRWGLTCFQHERHYNI